MPSFEASVAVLGVLLMLGALVSGIAERSFLSLTAMFVLAGFLVGNGGLQWVDFRAHSGFVADLAFAALIVILFRDGLEVEGEMLQRAWRLPLRKLVLAMPITAIVIAAAARLLFGLTWTESFLVGAVLSPTDPVLTSSIVTNPRVPRLIRHSLNLEVRPQRRARAACGARLRGRAQRELARFRVVAVRAPGRGARVPLRDRLRLARLPAHAGGAHAGAARSFPGACEAVIAASAAEAGAPSLHALDPAASQVPVRAWRRLRDLRRHGPLAAGQRLHRGVRRRDRPRRAPAGPRAALSSGAPRR